MFAAFIAALMIAASLPACAAFGLAPNFSPTTVMALRTSSCRRPPAALSLAVRAALSDDDDIKPSDAYKAASPDARREADERDMEAVTEAGRRELAKLADQNKREQEELRKKIEQVRASSLPLDSGPPRKGKERVDCVLCIKVQEKVVLT